LAKIATISDHNIDPGYLEKNAPSFSKVVKNESRFRFEKNANHFAEFQNTLKAPFDVAL
jgi:hypothetical protein